MKQFKMVIYLFTLIFAFAFIVQAQEAVELEKTVVTATKTERMLQEVPASVSVVTSEEIERKGATSVADLLRDIPGVEILLNSSPASPAGNDSRREVATDSYSDRWPKNIGEQIHGRRPNAYRPQYDRED